jgi:hypothetical protein
MYQSRLADFNKYIGVNAPLDSKRNVYVSKLLNDSAVRYQIVSHGNYIHERILQKMKLANDIRFVVAQIEIELNK